MSSSYGDLNLAQSVSTGPHGALLRLVSRIAMLTLEVPAAMKAHDWPEQRRIRGDLDEALSRLDGQRSTWPPESAELLQTLRNAGQAAVGAIVATPRDSPEAIRVARLSASAASQAVDGITALLRGL